MLSIFGEKLCEAACQKRTINDEKTYSRFDPSAGTASAMFESSSLGATVDRPMVIALAFIPTRSSLGGLSTNNVQSVRCFCGEGSLKRMVNGLHSPSTHFHQNDGDHGRLEDHGLLGDGWPVRDCIMNHDVV